MKSIKNLFMAIVLAMSFLPMNPLQNITKNIRTVNNEVPQLELVSETLSERQEENIGANGYSLENISRGYGDSAYSSANMINYNLDTQTTTFENFDINSYDNRNSPTAISGSSLLANMAVATDELTDVEKSESYIPEDASFAVSPSTILGSDERTQIHDTRSWPYRGIVKMYMTFERVFNNEDGTYRDRTYIGTGFMEGPNLMVTAGHCAYSDVTSSYTDKNGVVHSEFDDNVDNPRFPDIIRVYAGLNGSSELTSSYIYYAEVSVINIQKEYYENPSFDYDWSAMQLDRDLGVQTGYYGKISNWYSENASVYSYGYPGDKSDTMWESHGTLIESTTYRYRHNFDSVGGQSGSPVFMTSDTGSVYVCGIHTSGGSTSNGATRINSFIFHYLNSFVTHRNYEHIAATIVPTDYGFADAYPTDDYTKTNYTTHTLSSGFQFKTRRYRTGYIHNEYIVMSVFRTGITEAFIEYSFDVPVTKIDVDLSHWRELSTEWTYSSSCNAVLRIPTANGYTTVLDLLSESTNLPTNRTNPKTYTIEFPEPVYSFEFYMQSLRPSANDSNRGRICIGNLNVYTKEGWY